MSVMIETTEELLNLLKKLNVKVANVEDLRHLLTTINAHYNPQAARVRMAKLVAISVPCSLGAIAGFTSMLLTGATHDSLIGPYFVGALALIWGSCALVSFMALIFGFSLLIGRQSNATIDQPPPRPASAVEERVVKAITHDLSI
jgi:hypothetical protein